MKKSELIEFLKPFNDEIEIILENVSTGEKFDPHIRYELRKGEGFAIISSEGWREY